MNRPYMKALNRPVAGVEEPFMKKDMVIGTIGNTHGVRSIANPHSTASSISAHSEPPASCSSSVMAVASVLAVASVTAVSAFAALSSLFVFSGTDAAAASASFLSFISKSQSSGAPQELSVQLEDVIMPFRMEASSATLIFCATLILSKKTSSPSNFSGLSRSYKPPSREYPLTSSNSTVTGESL